MAPFSSSSAQRIDSAIEALGAFAGLIIAACLLTGLRAWLLSICVGLVAPAFTLPFWQWLLIAFTARLFLASPQQRD